MTTERIADYPVESLFLNRWSPRAYDGNAMPEADLRSMLEAARWAPSAYNVQPWRFLYSLRDDENWQDYVDLLDPFNAAWAQHASALLYVLSDTVMPGDGDRPEKPSGTHSFDAGAAWAQLALQATSLGYQAHAMAGLYRDLSRIRLHIPDQYRIEIAIAIGKRAAPSILSNELQTREQPSQRFALDKIAFAGRFPQ